MGLKSGCNLCVCDFVFLMPVPALRVRLAQVCVLPVSRSIPEIHTRTHLTLTPTYLL
jgi:hypothetical protein